MINRNFLLIIFLFSSVAAISQPGLRILGLEESIGIGLTNATQILEGQNSVEQAGAQLLYAYGQYLPNLIFAGGYNYASGNSMLTTSPAMATLDRSAYNYQLTSNINIYSGEYNRANLRASILNKKSVQLTLRWARQQVALDIIQTYLQVTLDKKMVSIESDNLNYSLKRQDQITALTQVGRLTVVDLYQQQAQTSQDEAALSNARNKLRSDKILFMNKLRLDIRDSLDKYDLDELALDDKAQADKYDNELTMVEQALSNRADLQSYRLNIDVADWNIKKYRSGYFPKLSLELGAFNSGAYYDYLYYSHQNQTPTGQNSIGFQFIHQVYGLAGLNATWNIFDNFFTKSNIINARAIYSNTQIDYRDQRLQVVTDVRTVFGNYKNDLQIIATSDKGVAAAQKAFDAMQARYTQGSASFIDVITTQVALLTAKQSQVQAIISLMMEKKNLDYLQGTNY